MTQTHRTHPDSTTNGSARRVARNSARRPGLRLAYDGVTAAYVRDISSHGRRRPADNRMTTASAPAQSAVTDCHGDRARDRR
jgi:hypothetical protein